METRSSDKEKKTSRKSRESALKTIKSFLSKSISRRKSSLRKPTSSEKKRSKTLKSSDIRRLNTIKKNIFGRKIKKKILEKRSKITAHFLNTVCSDSGYCLAFGKESTKINNFFEFFHNFNYVKNVRKINNGANGNILLLNYEREKYNSYAIMKKNIKLHSDSVMYEYIVGRYFINHYYKIYPCFLQTYGFSLVDNTMLDEASRNNDVLKTLDIMNLDLSGYSEEFNAELTKTITLACQEPTNLALIIENVPKPKTLEQMLGEWVFIERELIHVLFQIYYVLNDLGSHFTHYDLHMKNVLLYEPVPGGYIEFHYQYKGKEIVFDSKYIVKIIDYGRSYFKNSSLNLDSEDIYNLVCSLPDCNRNISSEGDNDCGKKIGFQWLRDKHYVSSGRPSEVTHINTTIPNRSHDLRLLRIVADVLEYDYPRQKQVLLAKTGTLERIFIRLMNKIVYDGSTGTRERINAVEARLDATQTVSDACVYLSRLLSEYSFNNYSYRSSGVKLIGSLFVYGNRREMNFIENRP